MIRLLAYHQVNDRFDFAWNCVSPRALRNQMKVLRDRGLEGIPFREAALGETDRQVGITFDDAYACVIQYALPILTDFGFRATLFPAVQWEGRNNLWDSRLVGRRVRHASWKELEKAAALGWEIGSHGLGHRDLTTLGEDDLRNELVQSRQEIEERLDVEVISIAYPFGQTDDRVVRLAAEAGYRFGCLSVPNAGGDLFRLGRMGVRRFDTILDFQAKIGGGPLLPFQVIKDRIAHYCSRATPLISQKGAFG